VAFHGGGANAGSMIGFSGLNQKSDEAGFIVVYPNGTGRLKQMLTFNGGNRHRLLLGRAFGPDVGQGQRLRAGANRHDGARPGQGRHLRRPNRIRLVPGWR
jgi:hypothetical protein